MKDVAYIIIIFLLLLSPLFSILSRVRFKQTAKAGKVSKFAWGIKLAYDMPKTIKCGDSVISVANLKSLYVHGNSMKDYQILDGQYVFVKPFDSEKERASIKTCPVLVFNITNAKIQSKYKLRKFICYVDVENIDWESIYKNNQERIRVSKGNFIDTCTKKAGKLNQKNGHNYILSETFDEEKEEYAYSLHHVSTVYAKVLYACSIN